MAIDNIALVRRFTDEVWNKGNMSVCDELLSPKIKTRDPMFGLLDGIEAAKRQVLAFRTAFPDFHVSIDDVGAIGDKVYVRWTATGTHTGSLLGMPPTNRKGINSGITYNRLEGGKFMDAVYVWDVYGMLEQMGMLQPIHKLVAGAMQQPAARAPL